MIILNEDQKEALNRIKQWFNGDSPLFTLAGYAGTGKTTLTNFVIKELRTKVVVTAPTHKACKVIASKTSRTAATIHSLLGLRPNVDLADFNINNPKFHSKHLPYLGMHSLIILDEASMLNKSLFKKLVEVAGVWKVKILFVGDPAQLPPIKEELSEVFKVEDQFTLKQIMRTADHNSLIPIFSEIRDNLDTYGNIPRVNSVNDKGEGIEFFNADELATELQSLYRSGKDVKTLAYYNSTVKYWNNVIRAGLFRNAPQLVLSDKLTAYSTVSEPKRDVIQNSSDYTVVDMKETTLHGLDGYEILLRENEEEMFASTFILNSADGGNIKKFKSIFEPKLEAAIKFKRWKDYYEFKNSVLLQEDVFKGKRLLIKKDVDYGYALTVHKSQGSTYDNAAVIEANINRNNIARERNQLKYVALTRAAKKCLIL